MAGLLDFLRGDRSPLEALRDGGNPAPGAIKRGPNGEAYQYAETRGMQGATGDQGWIPVNAAGGRMRDRLRDLAPMIMMMDPLGRNQAAAAMMMRQQEGRKKDAKDAQNQTETFKWLQAQGVDEGTAQYLAGDNDALRQWFGERRKSGQPDWKIQRLLNDQGQEQDFLVDLNNPTNKQPMGGARTDAMSPELVEQKARIAREGASKTIGTPPAGYSVQYDEQGNPVRMQPVPGGPADTSAKDAVAAGTRSTASDVITGAASKARDILNEFGRLAVGTGGRVMSTFGESQAAELRRQVDVLKSNATIETLGAMRAASPTGGALGAVSDSENAMLAAKAGALDPNAGPEQFAAQLDDYERTLLRLIHGQEAGDRIFLESRGTGDVNPAQGGDVVDYREFFGGQ